MRIPTIVQRLHCSCSQRLKVANCMKTLGLHTCQHKPPWTNFRKIHTKTTPLHVQKNRRFRCKRMRCDLNSMSTLRTSCPCRRMQQCYTMRTMHLRILSTLAETPAALHADPQTPKETNLYGVGYTELGGCFDKVWHVLGIQRRRLCLEAPMRGHSHCLGFCIKQHVSVSGNNVHEETGECTHARSEEADVDACQIFLPTPPLASRPLHSLFRNTHLSSSLCHQPEPEPQQKHQPPCLYTYTYVYVHICMCVCYVYVYVCI
jgi:hypothetical protein